MSAQPIKFRSWLSPGIRPEVFEGLARHMADCMGREVALEFSEHASGPTAAENPFVTGEVDLGWMCATAYVELSSVELVGAAWVPDDEDTLGKPQYFSDLILSRGAAADLTDLQGLRVGCNDRISLSGYHALRIALAELGHNIETFVRVVVTGGHHQSLAALDAGAVDAIVIDSVTRTVERPTLEPTRRLGPWPTQPLVAAASLHPMDRARIGEALLSATDNPHLAGVLRKSGIHTFAPISPQAYATLATHRATHAERLRCLA